MIATTVQHLSANTSEVFAQVDDVCEPLVVERANGNNIVMLLQSDYNSIMETLHQLSSAANVAHLQKSMAQAEAGNYKAITVDKLWK